MNTLEPIVINGHGAKTNKIFDIKDHTLLTPENLSIPYVFAIDPSYSIEKDFQQYKVKNIQNGHWTFYSQDHNHIVNDVAIGPWQANELKTFAHNILTNASYWSDIDHQHQYYLAKDPNATLVVKKGNNYLHLTSKEAEAFLNKVEKGTYSSAQDGTALFFYAANIGKVKTLSHTSLSEVLEQIEEIAGPKLVMLATCNAGNGNKTVTYDTHSAKQDVHQLAKMQDVDLQRCDAPESISVDASPERAQCKNNDFNKINHVKYEAKDAFENQHFQYGPLNKSVFTQQLELLVKCVLKNPTDFTFSAKSDFAGKQQIHAQTKGIDINVTDLLHKANFSHFEFDLQDSKLFNNSFGLANHFKNVLTNGEVAAIESYTGNGYYSMNCFLYGNAFECDNYSLKSSFIKSLFVASGLNKIMPDLISSETYRGDKPDYAQLMERIELVKAGGGVTETPAFFSTSLSEQTAKCFAGNCIIHFEDRYGKNISTISHFPGEQEYLLEPSSILWTKYEFINNKHVFHAQKVEPLTNADQASAKEMQSFIKLFDWANNHGVNTHFITPWLKSTLNEAREESILPKVKSEPISLSDCITMDNHAIDNHLGQTTVLPNATVNTAQDVTALAVQMQHLEINPIATVHIEM